MSVQASRNHSAPWYGRVLYRAKLIGQEPTSVVGLLLILLFGWLIVVPVISLLSDAVLVQFGDERRTGAMTGEFTLYYLQRALFSPISELFFWSPLMNTLAVAFQVILFSLVIGGLLGWLVSRTNVFGKRWLATLLIVPYMIPAWTFALAWHNLFKNRSVGGQRGWVEAMGMTPPDWLAYGQIPIIVILTLNFIPFVILLFGNALRNLDSQLEESARILGASPRYIASRIVLPLMLPALTSASVLIFAKVLGEFGVAYVLGLPVDYNVLSTSLYRSIESRQTGMAAVLAGTIMLLGILSLMIDLYLIREAKRFVTLGGKSSLKRVTALGSWRMPASALAWVVFVVSVCVPLATLFLSTLMHVPGIWQWSNFTLDYWVGQDLRTIAMRQGILLTPELWQVVWNTVWIVGVSALIAGILGLLVGYVVVRSPVKGIGPVLRQITFFPYLVPGIAFAAAYLSLFAVPRGPIPALYGTYLILILALIADEMPFASRAGISAMMQLGRDPEEAARVAGARWWRRLLTIIVPIQKGALVTGILLPFISGINGLSLFIILSVPSTEVLTTYAIRLIDYHYTQAANAVVLLIVVLAIAGTLAAQKLTRTNLAEGLGR
ncbi:MAG: iron ABC transporter permease [Saccharospirillum sp.]|nr:iron ABC transporter permease [Saccharospirillum sp.]